MAAPISFEPGRHDRWSLAAIGPVIQRVQVGLHPETGKAFRAAGRQIPEPATMDGLLDTGSDCCVIKRTLAEELQLKLLDNVSITGVQGDTETAPLYYVRIILPNGVQHLTRIVGADMGGAYRLILGRDLLQKCLFTYNGPEGSWRLDFPSRDR